MRQQYRQAAGAFAQRLKAGMSPKRVVRGFCLSLSHVTGVTNGALNQQVFEHGIALNLLEY
jgi:hypothetical protein